MRTSIIVAIAENGVIGRGGDLPWRLSEDLKRFKDTTMGKPIIMGRKTWESIGRPLPGRPHVVISRDAAYAADGVDVVQDVEAAIVRARTLAEETRVDEMMIIGGAEIYRLTLPITDRMYVTEIHSTIEGDTHFPEFERDEWRETAREGPLVAEKSDLTYSFIQIDRK